MSRLIYIQASPRGARSVSTAVADAFVAAYRKARPAAEIKVLNPFAADLPPFDGAVLNAKYAVLNGLEFSREEQDAWGRVVALSEEFKSFDRYVIAAPMWNFSIPYRLKHYLDLIIQPGLTFSFTPEEGYRGLVTGKPVFLALARGGEYPAGSPGEAWDLQLKYLKNILGFIGFTDIRTVVAEPTLGAPDITTPRRDEAIAQATRMGSEF
jgi:FMN-dependent NADH-azoreductase